MGDIYLSVAWMAKAMNVGGARHAWSYITVNGYRVSVRSREDHFTKTFDGVKIGSASPESFTPDEKSKAASARA